MSSRALHPIEIALVIWLAYWPHRLALIRGRMPVSKTLPYEWYDTPNIRCATIYD